MIVERHVHEDDELAQYLRKHLNIPLDWPEEAQLTAAHIADIASAAACDVAYDQAANSHLLDLIAALPLPGEDSFWTHLWQASGNAYLLPVNVKHAVSQAAHGESGLASHLLSFVAELNNDQRTAVARMIGDTLSDLAIEDDQHIGELWLRDAQITAWRVLLAGHSNGTKNRGQFFEAWQNA